MIKSNADNFGTVGPQNLPRGNGGFGQVFVKQPEEVGPQMFDNREHFKVKSENEEVNESKHFNTNKKWIKIENSIVNFFFILNSMFVISSKFVGYLIIINDIQSCLLIINMFNAVEIQQQLTFVETHV